MKTTIQFALIGVILSATLSLSAQVSFNHSLGASYYAGGYAAAPAIMYSPRLNIIELADEATISIGTHLGLGITANSREGASSLALDFPIMAEANFGMAANPDTRSSFGGFAGIGYGYSLLGSASAFGNDYNEASGLVLNAGANFLITERPLGVRLSYLINSKEDFSNVFGIGVYYIFGSY